MAIEQATENATVQGLATIGSARSRRSTVVLAMCGFGVEAAKHGSWAIDGEVESGPRNGCGERRCIKLVGVMIDANSSAVAVAMAWRGEGR